MKNITIVLLFYLSSFGMRELVEIGNLQLCDIGNQKCWKNGIESVAKSEVANQQSDVGSRNSESQKSEIGSQKSDVGGWQ